MGNSFRENGNTTAMRQTYWQAYQQVLESERNRGKVAKTVEVRNGKVKPYRVRRTAGRMNRPISDRVEQDMEIQKGDPRRDDENTVIRASQSGVPVDGKAKRFIRAKDLNAKYRGKGASPFYRDEGSRCTPSSGVFSQDGSAVFAAIEQGVPTNRTVRSKLLSRMSFYGNGLGADIFEEDVGMVDALTWQCWCGNSANVRQILRAGYDVPKSYSGMNPLTAAVEGRNLECLKLVLSVPGLLELVNSPDGHGNYPLVCAATIRGIDPYEFAKVLVESGARDDHARGSEYGAAMLSLMGGSWTPNLFGELLPVTDLDRRVKGLDLRGLAESIGNREAVLMIDNYRKYGDESINQAVTHSLLISHV